MIEHRWGDAEFPVRQGPNSEEVRHHSVDGGGFTEGPGNGRSVVASSERGAPSRTGAYKGEDGLNYVWRLPCPEDIRTDLVSFDNPQGRITNSDLELAAFFLQEATSPFVCTSPAWRAPFTGSENTPTVAWSFR